MIDNIENIDSIPIIHVPASEALTMYEKPEFVNGCRLGKIMYGFTEDESLELESTLKLCSEVIHINDVKKGETVGYSGAFKAEKDIRLKIAKSGTFELSGTLDLDGHNIYAPGN